MFADLAKSANSVGVSHRYKYSCIKTRGIGSVESQPLTIKSFQIGGKWFKPNYHAHIVFDWMDHDTGKSRKLNDDDMMQMQTLASEILSMERGQSKTETGKEHLERNDFIIEKQRAELERIEAERQHKEH